MGGDTDRIRVVLVDDEELIRAGLALVLASEPDIDVIGEAGEGTSGINAIASLRPDVVVMDVRMRGTDGVTATRLLNSEEYEAEHGTPPPVLILTTFGDDEDVDSALRSGAAEFLLKNSAPQILAAAIRALARGEGWIDSSVTRSLLRQFSNASGPDSNQVRRRLTGPAEPAHHTARAGGAGGHGPRPEEQPNSQGTVPQRDDGQVPRAPHPDEARPQRQIPGCGGRIPLWLGRARGQVEPTFILR